MTEILYYAFPYFILLLLVEFLSFRHLQSDDLIGYDFQDSRTSITMGIGNVIINVAWRMAVLAQWRWVIYQAGINTGPVGRLGRPVEPVLNTPSHHRVHHASNEQYLDKNYGGILVIWDRLFGTFAPERERVTYGLTTNID